MYVCTMYECTHNVYICHVVHVCMNVDGYVCSAADSLLYYLYHQKVTVHVLPMLRYHVFYILRYTYTVLVFTIYVHTCN